MAESFYTHRHQDAVTKTSSQSWTHLGPLENPETVENPDKFWKNPSPWWCSGEQLLDAEEIGTYEC